MLKLCSGGGCGKSMQMLKLCSGGGCGKSLRMLKLCFGGCCGKSLGMLKLCSGVCGKTAGMLKLCSRAPGACGKTAGMLKLCLASRLPVPVKGALRRNGGYARPILRQNGGYAQTLLKLCSKNAPRLRQTAGYAKELRKRMWNARRMLLRNIAGNARTLLSLPPCVASPMQTCAIRGAHPKPKSPGRNS